MAAAVEFEGGLQGELRRDVGGRGGEGLQGGVEVRDVGLVVLRVVELHDLAGDVGLEGLVGESVRGMVMEIDGILLRLNSSKACILMVKDIRKSKVKHVDLGILMSIHLNTSFVWYRKLGLGKYLHHSRKATLGEYRFEPWHQT